MTGKLPTASPDCFYVIYEIGKGTSGALMSEVKKIEKQLEQAVKHRHHIGHDKEQFDDADQRPRGRRPHFKKRIEYAKGQQRAVEEKLDQARQNYETVRRAKAEIGEVYHPYNVHTGQRQDSQIVSGLLADCLNRIQTATTDLSDRCKKHVQKAQRVVDSMVATIAIFFQMIEIYLDNMQLSERDRHLMRHNLIPGHYLKIAADKERDIDRKALTVVHNYYIKRRDGTTAAERFFEAKPDDLFEYLLDHMDYPVRPRNRLKLAA
ncbi:MAG: hypothetical protein HKP58_00835 [Desulfatitalea sp.]|nr:hypothetical protein [Desulfatitalea sp.]NNJ98931.1 hypothetical protein [Desulfatitalea sp.]